MELAAAPNWLKRLKVKRWYSFLRMQVKVSRRLSKNHHGVSECSKKDISKEFGVSQDRFRVVPNGINTDYFYPLTGVERKSHHLLVTNSADTPLKGLKYLLLAVNDIRKIRPIRLTVIGKPKKEGMIERLVGELGVGEVVHFTGRIPYEDFARYYAEATMAVIPSLYEGFGMPAGEAMACGVPVISTTGGALPEVVGDAGFWFPQGIAKPSKRPFSISWTVRKKRAALGQAGLKRVQESLTWEHAARKTVAIYREEIHAYH